MEVWIGSCCVNRFQKVICCWVLKYQKIWSVETMAMDNVWTIKLSNETENFTFGGLSVVSNVNYFSNWYFNVARNRVIMISL